MDKLKQDLTKPMNMVKEEKRNSLERKTNSTQQLEISEKLGIIKTDNQFVHGKNKLYAPRIVRKEGHTRDNTTARTIDSRGKK